jgi:hypothetical protein
MRAWCLELFSTGSVESHIWRTWSNLLQECAIRKLGSRGMLISDSVMFWSNSLLFGRNHIQAICFLYISSNWFHFISSKIFSLALMILRPSHHSLVEINENFPSSKVNLALCPLTGLWLPVFSEILHFHSIKFMD